MEIMNMIKRKFTAHHVPSSQDAFETKYFMVQLERLSKKDKQHKLWTWIKQGTISYQQFCSLLDYLGNFEAKP